MRSVQAPMHYCCHVMAELLQHNDISLIYAVSNISIIFVDNDQKIMLYFIAMKRCQKVHLLRIILQILKIQKNVCLQKRI